MNQLAASWAALPLRRRIIAALAGAAILAAVLGLARLSGRTDQALLYSGLDPVAAGEVLAALDQQGAAYEVQGSAIYVDAARRDSLRMSLAAEGLPAAGAQGYELLDSLSGFGTTAQMFDAAYWRAREGELARTILSSPDIRAARVHISATGSSPFDRGFTPSASVAVTTTGAPVPPELAQALRFLVASAVGGLSPDRVSVIDSRTGTVLQAEPAQGTDPSGRAEELRANVQRLLEARVGPGRAVVEVAVAVGSDSEQITERRIDPDSRVQISTETEERSNQSSDQDEPGVTVASNLPAGDAAAGAGQSSSQTTETRERVNFEVSESRREVIRAPGEVRRITVAVLVDGLTTANEAGEPVWQPRPEEELAALRDLVASAVGFDEARGDVITIRSLQFLPLPETGTEAAAPAGLAAGLDIGLLAQLAALSAVALVLGLFVLRPALLAARPELPGLPAPAPSNGPAPAAEAGLPALTGTIDDGDPGALPDLPGFAGFAGGMDAGEDPVARLRRLIEERREETLDILRSWVEEPEETA